MRVGATSDDQLDLIQATAAGAPEIYTGLKDSRDALRRRIRRRYPNIPRRVSGYNLDDLLPEKGFHVARALVGSESTCALVLSATLRLAAPAVRARAACSSAMAAQRADDVCRGARIRPRRDGSLRRGTSSQTWSERAIEPGMKLLPQGDAWMMVEFGGECQAEANSKAEAVCQAARRGRTGTSNAR